MEREEQANIGNCPYCTKIIFKDATFNSEASFSMRCPHCNKTVRVIIKHRIEIKIVAVQEESKPKKSGPAGGTTNAIMVIMILYLPPLMHCLMHHADDIIDIFT